MTRLSFCVTGCVIIKHIFFTFPDFSPGRGGGGLKQQSIESTTFKCVLAVLCAGHFSVDCLRRKWG